MPGWDMIGPVHDRPGLGAPVFFAPPPAPVRADAEEILVFQPQTTNVPLQLPTDLSPVRDGLFAISEQFRLYRQEQTYLREMLQEALLPWYVKLWRWVSRSWPF